MDSDVIAAVLHLNEASFQLRRSYPDISRALENVVSALSKTDDDKA